MVGQLLHSTGCGFGGIKGINWLYEPVECQMDLLPFSMCLETVHPQGQAGRQTGILPLHPWAHFLAQDNPYFILRQKILHSFRTAGKVYMGVNWVFFRDCKSVFLMENTRFKSPHSLWCDSMGSPLLPHFGFIHCIFLVSLGP